jgi:hypothetical protein
MYYGSQRNTVLLKTPINWFLTNSIEIVQEHTLEDTFNEGRN